MRVIVNEWLTEPIPLSCGVRQGDSLSLMLYTLCVETLACKIRSCPEIEGFLLPGAKGSQYKVGIQGRIQELLIGGSKLWFRKDCWTLLRQITSPPHPLPPVAVVRYNSLASYRLLGFYS